MATCSDHHEEISFAGEFSALCPLCALRRSLSDAQESEISKLRSDIDEQQGEIESLESRLDSVSQEYAEYRRNNPKGTK